MKYLLILGIGLLGIAPASHAQWNNECDIGSACTGATQAIADTQCGTGERCVYGAQPMPGQPISGGCQKRTDSNGKICVPPPSSMRGNNNSDTANTDNKTKQANDSQVGTKPCNYNISQLMQLWTGNPATGVIAGTRQAARATAVAGQKPATNTNPLKTIFGALFGNNTKKADIATETLQITGREFVSPFLFCHRQSPTAKPGICACEGKVSGAGCIIYTPGANPECAIKPSCIY